MKIGDPNAVVLFLRPEDAYAALKDILGDEPDGTGLLSVELQRPRVEQRVGGVDLDSMSERELERLHAGLVPLASLDDSVLAALVEHLLAGDEAVSSS